MVAGRAGAFAQKVLIGGSPVKIERIGRAIQKQPLTLTLTLTLTRPRVPRPLVAPRDGGGVSPG